MNEEPQLLTIPSLIVFALLIMVLIFGVMLFGLIWYAVEIKDVMIGLLGALLTAVYGWVNIGIGFYFGNSQAGKTANAALTQLAGAGPPPPAPPVKE